MINRILIILALLLGLLPAQAQFQSVTTTANGTLHSPTNLWAQNSLAIANALAANPGVKVVRRAADGDTIGEGVWLAANVSELTMSPADYSGTLINAGPGVLELYNDQPNLVATVRPGETISYTFDDDDNDITITSRWSPAPLPTTNGLLARTGDGTTAARTITAGDSNIIWTNGSGVSGNPTSSINATQTGNRTYSNNLAVQGNTTLGDASGDTLTILPQTITASNANGTAAGSIANVGTLDNRYPGTGTYRIMVEQFSMLGQFFSGNATASINRGRQRLTTTTTTNSTASLVTQRGQRNSANAYITTVGNGISAIHSGPPAENIIGLFYGAATESGATPFDPLGASGFSMQLRVVSGNWEARGVYKNGATEVTGSWQSVGLTSSGAPLLESAVLATADGYRMLARNAFTSSGGAWTFSQTVTGITWGALGNTSGLSVINTAATGGITDIHQISLILGGSQF
jgi:hypothetical protein